MTVWIVSTGRVDLDDVDEDTSITAHRAGRPSSDPRHDATLVARARRAEPVPPGPSRSTERSRGQVGLLESARSQALGTRRSELRRRRGSRVAPCEATKQRGLDPPRS